MTRWTVFAMVSLLCCPPAGPAAEQQGKKTRRIYLMGSSLTDQVKYSSFEKLAESRGHEHIWGKHQVPGAPIRWLWAHRTKGNGRKPYGPLAKALGEYRWDAITLEPRDGYEPELQAAGNVIRYALTKSPDVQVYVFAQWPRIRGGSFDRQWLADSKDIQNNIRLGFEEFLKDLRKAHPDIKPPLMIPVGHAMHLLELKIRAGLVPGMKSIYDGYSDGSHQNHLGEYIVGCTFFATIYRESPVGLPTEPYGEIPADLAAAIQQTVWEAVNAHPHSGVEAEGQFRILTPWFPDAVSGEPFGRELKSAFGEEPVTWSLGGGALPRGIRVDPNGLLAGTCEGTGEFDFTLKATDSRGRTALRELKLACVPESVPAIPEQAIPALTCGEYLDYRLKVRGGNGEITWRLVGSWIKAEDGKEWTPRKRGSKHRMVPGLELSHTGILSGSPACEGTYKLRVLAADADPNAPDKAEREVILNVGPPGKGACIARWIDAEPEIDGKPDAAFGELGHKVTRGVKGAPSCSARFGVVYDRRRIYVAVDVKDDKVVGDSEDVRDDDGIELYFDRNNNREKEYNSDDCRIVCSVSGRVHAFNLEQRRVTCAFVRTQRGYTGEIRIGFNGRRKPNRVYGFDLGVNDNDGKGAVGRIMWKGGAENETDTSGFGAMIFAEPAKR